MHNFPPAVHYTLKGKASHRYIRIVIPAYPTVIPAQAGIRRPRPPPPSFPRKRESRGGLTRLRHYKAAPLGIPAYAGMTVGDGKDGCYGTDSRLRGNDGRGSGTTVTIPPTPLYPSPPGSGGRLRWRRSSLMVNTPRSSSCISRLTRWFSSSCRASMALKSNSSSKSG